MDKKKEEKLMAKSRSISIKEGSFYSLMDGFGLRYVAPFALALNATKLQIGFLSSLPSLLGNSSQLFTTKLLEKNSRKKIVSTSVLLQASMWLMLIFIGAIFFIFDVKNSVPAWMLVFGYTLLVLFGSVGGPAWSSWMRDLTRNIKFGEYFGKRSRLVGIIALISMLIAGLILDHFKKFNIFLGFVILFSIAFIGRFVSGMLFKRKYEPKFEYKKEKHYFSLIQFVKKMHSNNFGRFVIFTSLMAFAVNVVSPFFAVYELQNLNFSYIQYTTTIVVSSLVSLLLMPSWGRFADKYGNLLTIKNGAIFIVAIPLFWLFTPFLFLASPMAAFIWILCIEIISGIGWSAYNLSAGNFIYDAVTKEKMTLCISYFSIINGIGAFIGASLGGLIASNKIIFIGLNSIMVLSFISGIIRLGVLIFMGRKINEVRKVNITERPARELFRAITPSPVFNFIDNNILKHRAY